MRNDVSSLAQLTTHSPSKDRRGVANFFEASEHVPSVRRFDFSACLAPACRQPTDRLGSAPHRSLFFGIIATFCTSLIHPTTSTMSCFNGASRSLRSRSKKKRNEAGCLRKMRHIWWCAGLHFHLHGGHTSLALNEIADGTQEVPVGLTFDASWSNVGGLR